MSIKLLVSVLSDEDVDALRGDVPGSDLLVGIVSRLTAAEIAGLQAAAPDVEVLVAHRPDEARAMVAEADALFGWLTPDIFRQATRLRWVQAASAGVEMFLFAEMVESDVVLTNARGLAAAQLADHTMAFVLSFARRMPTVLRGESSAAWAHSDALASAELAGQTLLVVGLGSTGREVARRAAAFDVRVLATGMELDGQAAGVEAVHPPVALDGLLPEADYVSICCALTPETRGLFGAGTLGRMKPGAYLTNVSRGAIVDHGALAEALASGHLAGAGLDVTEPEPLPAEHPLLRMENVILTPHCGGRSPMVRRRMVELLTENLRRFAAGEPLRHVVDKRAGY